MPAVTGTTVFPDNRRGRKSAFSSRTPLTEKIGRIPVQGLDYLIARETGPGIQHPGFRAAAVRSYHEWHRMDLLVNIDVDDLARAESFYTSAFSLSTERRFGSDGVELVGGTSRIYLLVKPPGSRATSLANATRGYGRHWTPVHLDFVVTDMDAALQRALNAGALLEQPVQQHAWGRLALMSDPFGHGFCLVQFHGNGYDEVATRP